MRFEWPGWLWLLLPAAWWLWRRHRRPRASLAYSSLALLAAGAVSWRTRWAWLPEVLRALAILAVILGLARPQWQVREQSGVRDGVRIELLVDVSSSMDMRLPSDQTGLTRLGTVKEVLSRFVLGDGKKLAGRPDDLIGLVSFARYADTISPLTEAHDALVELIRNLAIEDRPNEDGTAYGDAVTLAAARLHQLDREVGRSGPGARLKNRVIVLLTDGENNCGRHLPLEATALAKQWGIRIYVISLAESGQPPGLKGVPETARPMAVQILERMAEETGGLYRSAGDLESIQAVYEKIDALEKSRIQVAIHTGWRELFPECTGLALLWLAAEMAMHATIFRRIP